MGKGEVMRLVLFAALLLAALACDARPGWAHEGRWCAVMDIGAETVQRDCRFDRIEDCVPNVLAGNRGFCMHNPRWRGDYQPAAKERKARHKRRLVRH